MTSSDTPWLQVPNGWDAPSQVLLEHAHRRALTALALDGPAPAHHRLRAFYDVDGNYAGSTFAQLEPVHPDDITATDLHATSLLSVRIRPHATRRLLNDGLTRTEIVTNLRAIPDAQLQVADAHALVAMQHLYLSVKTAMSPATTRNPDAWVTTSKLCARKRPDLFPVRDTRIRDYLGIPISANGYGTTWLLFRALLQDSEIITAIDTAVDATGNGEHHRVRLDTSRLRLLDAALWTATLR
ncbi:DUF6308 family protein [Cellulomonas sp. ATA003]|uniref:DUF6308 family protein n=1 Tax=Cellulomonas sp. ATA003 TaxID=3073064 RepID=UPI002873E92F|nr:DUF6308 family protein [Cellulomonas sp. ATA003]WNB86441.1 DUF6308 family protein [Cellulomonas sp. ATA003]